MMCYNVLSKAELKYLQVSECFLTSMFCLSRRWKVGKDFTKKLNCSHFFSCSFHSGHIEFIYFSSWSFHSRHILLVHFGPLRSTFIFIEPILRWSRNRVCEVNGVQTMAKDYQQNVGYSLIVNATVGHSLPAIYALCLSKHFIAFLNGEKSKKSHKQTI